MKLSKSEVNHLRRLLGWMRCSEGVFQSPEEMAATWRWLADNGVTPSGGNETRERLMKSYNLSAHVPLYVRAGLKALTASLREYERDFEHGGVVDAKRETNRLEAPKARET